MAEHESWSQKNREKVEQKHGVNQVDFQPLFERFQAWGQGTLSIGETQFFPRMDEHAELLARAPSDRHRASLVLQLQQTYGNRYLQRLVESMKVQTKLTVSTPNDAYGPEADRVAEAVTGAANSQVQRQEETKLEEEETEEEEKEPIQTKATPEMQRQPEEEEEIQTQPAEEEEIQTQPVGSHPTMVSENLEVRIKAERGGGHPLSDTIREPMERVFGTDFSSVRIHTNPEADLLNQQLSARAFTTGRDIFFRENEYSPGSNSGRELIAHELTHVVQQRGEKSGGALGKESISVNGAEQEREADSIAGDVALGHRALSMNRITITQSSKPAIRKQESSPAETSAEERRHAGESEPMFSYCGFVHQTLRESKYNRYIEEARSTTVSDVIGWVRRGSTRSIRTADTSSRMCDWLEAHVSNFPGRIRLEENQYWKLNPGVKKMWLCTIDKRAREQRREREESEEEAQSEETAGIVSTMDPIYMQLQERFGPFVPWVSPETARMVLQQHDPRFAAEMLARELSLKYWRWVGGGEDGRRDFIIPATWYLKVIPVHGWSIDDWFERKAIGEASERMRWETPAAEFSAKLTNFILFLPAAFVSKALDVVKPLIEEGIKKIFEELDIPDETIEELERAYNVIELALAIKGGNPDEIVSASQSLIGNIVSSYQEKLAEYRRIAEQAVDDSGYWIDLGVASDLQEIYFYHRLVREPANLREFLDSKGIGDRLIYDAIWSRLSELRRQSPS